MKSNTMLTFLSSLVVCSAASVLTAESAVSNDAILRQTFELGGEYSQETQHFSMESKLITYALDIYIDLATNWGKKVTLDELVVTETTLPMPPGKINAVIERNIIIRNVSEKERL